MIDIATIRGEAPGTVAAYYVNDLPGVFGDLDSASQWFGAGAEQLRLTGAVTEAVLTELLTGRIAEQPHGTRGSTRSDHRLRLGLEVLFAPPKSVSIEALAGRRADIVAADAEAVRFTMRQIEKLVRTRNWVDGKQGKEFTNSIVAALLRHETSRKGDPHLHTHALIMNMTPRADNQWRAINNDLILQNQKHFIRMYQARLQTNLLAAGYELRKAPDGSFELANYSDEQIEAFSSGKKAMNAYLTSSGIAPHVASTAQKHWAWRKTREAKPSERDLQQLHAEWQTVITAVGITFQDRGSLLRARPNPEPGENQTDRDEAASPPHAQTPALHALLLSAQRDTRFGPHPDPVAQDILKTRDSASALARIQGQLRRAGVEVKGVLAAGSSSIVLDAGEKIVRIGLGDDVRRPMMAEMLQSDLHGADGSIRWEVVTKVETSNITSADVIAMSRALTARGYNFGDAGTDNLGRLPDGRIVVIDPGSVTAMPGREVAMAPAKHADHKAPGQGDAGPAPASMAPANVWLGKGARLLGLHGAVDQADYEATLQSVITGHNGKRRRVRKEPDPSKPFVERLATTFELAAPRGIAIQAIFGGDERLITAHDAAVAYAASLIDKTARAVTYVNEQGDTSKTTKENFAKRSIINRTGNAVIAASRKQNNAAGSVDLYTQLVVMNLTRDFHGDWKSMESRLLFDRRSLIQTEYENRLAALVADIGYKLVRLPNGSFDLKQVEQEQIKALTAEDRGFFLRAPRAETLKQRSDMNVWLHGAMNTHHGMDPAALVDKGRQAAADLSVDFTQPPRPAVEPVAAYAVDVPDEYVSHADLELGSEGFEGGDDNALFRQMEGLSAREESDELEKGPETEHALHRDEANEHYANDDRDYTYEHPSVEFEAMDREQAAVDAFNASMDDLREQHEDAGYDRLVESLVDGREEEAFDAAMDNYRDAIHDPDRHYDADHMAADARGSAASDGIRETTDGTAEAIDEDPLLKSAREAEEAIHLQYANEAIIYAVNTLSQSQAVIFEHELLEKAFRYNIIHGTQRKYLLQALKDVSREGTALIAADTTYHVAGQLSKSGKEAVSLTRAEWIARRTNANTSEEEATQLADAAIAKGRLVPSEARYTTPKALQAEIDIVSIEKEMRGAVTPILSAAAAEKALQAYVEGLAKKGATGTSFVQTILQKLGIRKAPVPSRRGGFTPTQLEAAKMVLSTSNGIVGIQGIAGTGKTFTVDGITHVAKANGFEVVMIAPYRGQVSALRAEGNKADTMAKYLNEDERERATTDDKGATGLSEESVKAYVTQVVEAAKAAKPKQMLIVDEAGVISGADMARVEAIVLRNGAHMVALGDIAQTKPIGASPALDVLQRAGMQTVEMSDVQRQSTERGRAAVLAAARKDIVGSLELIGDENIHEIENDAERNRAIASAFTAMSPVEQDSTIIVTSTNDSKKEINELIRAALGNADAGVALESLTPKSLSNAEKRVAANYTIGDIVVNEKGLGSTLEQGKQYWMVGRSGPNCIDLADKDGNTVKMYPAKWNPENVSLYQPEVRRYAPGDMIRTTRKLTIYKHDENGEILRRKYQGKVYKPGEKGDPVIHFQCDSGELFKVHSVNGNSLRLLPYKDGRAQPGQRFLPIDKMDRVSFDYGWATSVHASQGIKSREAIINLDTKRRPTRHEVFYVAMSRAVEKMTIFTDIKELLPKKIKRVSEKYSALDISIANSGHALVQASEAHRLRKTMQTTKTVDNDLHANNPHTRSPTPAALSAAGAAAGQATTEAALTRKTNGLSL